MVSCKVGIEYRYVVVGCMELSLDFESFRGGAGYGLCI